MRVSDVRIPGKFKRFGSLEIQGLGVNVELVVMLGPNGSGKSSVFDAFLEWARAEGRQQRDAISDDYFDSETGTHGRPEIILHCHSPGSIGQSSPQSLGHPGHDRVGLVSGRS